MSEKPAPYWIGNVTHVTFPRPLELDGDRAPYGDEPEQWAPDRLPPEEIESLREETKQAGRKMDKLLTNNPEIQLLKAALKE